MKKILFIIGSTRRNSFNRRLANRVETMLLGKAEVSYLNYDSVPFFNQDTEFPTPDSVRMVREEILDSDGIWIFTPEYNRSYPGFLKNLVDWMSRTLALNDLNAGTVMMQKKVTVSGVSGKNAARSARKKLVEVLTFIDMDVYGEIGTGFAMGPDQFVEDKLEITNQELDALKAQAAGFLKYLD
ncbi:MAG: NAD(P)H-dependent oxidoreductase [Pseudobutyrivibrio ruminis]|nr:NAD(P)H-dependent oxidoreductase [Pseudobutyrivibrio ruminis]